MFNEKSNVIGVDISTSSVKIAHTVKTRKGLILRQYAESKTPVSALVAGVIRQPENVKEALDECLKHFNIKINKKIYAICTIPDDKIYIQEASFPKLEYKKLKEAIQFKIQTFIPLPLSEVYWDFEIISDTEKDDQSVKVIIAAAAKETVDSFYDVVKSAGLIPISFETSAIASLRVIEQKEKEENILLDIGKTQTTITLCNRDIVRFNSTVHTGLNQIVKEYGAFYNVDDDKSLQLIREAGVEVQNEELKSKVLEMFNLLKTEIEKTITYGNTKDIAHIYIFGEGSLVKGLKQILNEGLSAKLHPVETSIQLPQNVQVDRIVPVLGASVKYLGKKTKKTINFLPDKALKEIKANKIKDSIVFILRIMTINMAAYVAIFAVLGAFLMQEQGFLNSRLNSVNQTPQEQTYISTQNQINGYNIDLQKIYTASQAQINWIPFLEEVANTVPSGITLSSYNVVPNKNIWDVSISGTATNRATLLAYLNTLEYKSVYLTQVALPITYLQNDQSIVFTISAVINSLK